MRLKFFKSLSVLMSLILFISVINFPTLKVKADSGVEGFVERCYTVILGRPSEPGGLAYWTDALKKGERVGTNVAYGFVFSDEYANRNRTNEEFVNDMYSLVLDREADAGGYEYWCTKLENGETRQQVYGGFVNSPEFYGICQQYGITAGYFLAEYDYMQVNNVNLFVDRLYRTCLGRPGDQGGQEYWVRALINKEITGIECAAGFVNSIEYRNNGLSNEDYVENMYSACLGRHSEPNGKAYWVNALVNGMTRDELFAGFANSNELNDICAEYGITRGDYTPTDIGTFDPSNPNNTPIPDHTHNYNQKNTDSKYLKSSATCTEAAVYYMSCECGEYDENNTFTSGSPLGHAWDDGEETKEPTEKEEGIKTYKCTRCNETKTESIEKLNHTHVFDQRVVDPKYLKSAATCTEAAVYYMSCECGEKGTETFTLGEALGHQFDQENVDDKYLKSAATCTEAAVYYKSCVRCGAKDEENTFTLGEALGHDWDEGKVDKEATATENGIKTYRCKHTGCEETKTEVIPKDFSKAKVGDVITFGKYEQDGDETNGKEDIEWQVLSVEDNRILVLSKYGLDCKPYNVEDTDVTWETCTLRNWLNKDFYNTAFSENEKEYIPWVTIINKDNIDYLTDGGNNTTDKVFCLSMDEVEHYFGDYHEHMYGCYQNLICTPTQYAIEQGAYYSVLTDDDYNRYKDYGYTIDIVGLRCCGWWLRSPGSDFRDACHVYDYGYAAWDAVVSVNHNGTAVRPAMYIEFNQEDQEHTHAFSNEVADDKYLKKDATCTEPAEYYMSCECGEKGTETFTLGEALGHQFDQENIDDKYLKSAATCTEAAVYYKSCVRCGEKDEEHTFTSGDALGHDWDEGTVTKEATGTEDGIRTYSCKREGCNETKTEVIPRDISEVRVGDAITFGKYEQDGDITNGKEDIEWVVISAEGNSAFVISKYLLDYQPFNKEGGDVGWEDCSLREWLNDDFYNIAFSEEEKNRISYTTIDSVEDKLFIISREDVKEFPDFEILGTMGYQSALLVCSPTEYAKGLGVEPDYKYNGTAPLSYLIEHPESQCYRYLTRTNYEFDNSSVWAVKDYFISSGNFNSYGFLKSEPGAIRPAMYIEFNQEGMEHTHIFGSKVADDKYLKKEATCTEPSEYYMSCLCGERDVLNSFSYGEPLGHEWDEGTITRAATETEKGEVTYKCIHSGCKETLKTAYMSLSNVKAGDVVSFGRYDQDGNSENGQEEIEWIVLSVEDDRALVISKYVFNYNNPYYFNRWEGSSVREWLNNDFYNSAFRKEKENILSVNLENDDNPKYGTKGGEQTTDKLFCLSLSELNEYFGNYQLYSNEKCSGYNQELICGYYPTEYYRNWSDEVLTEELYNSNTYYNLKTDHNDLALKDIYNPDCIGEKGTNWILRTPGYDYGYYLLVSPVGYVEPKGYHGMTFNGGVRPAMYIKIDEKNQSGNNGTHEHYFNKRVVDDKYLISSATCTEPAIYYMSCKCGEKNNNSYFTEGISLGHDWNTCVTKDATLTEKGVITHRCDNCGETHTEDLNYIIKLGKYEQDGDESNGKEDIEWEVLTVEDGKALVVSKYALDSLPYNTEDENVTWETCSLRKWLNEDFYSSSFSDIEQKAIILGKIENNDNRYRAEATSSYGGNDTEDRVFCLSLDEVEKYYKDWHISEYEIIHYNQNLICEPTQYVINKGIICHDIAEDYDGHHTSEIYNFYGNNKKGVWWYLRTPGSSNNDVLSISSWGGLNVYVGEGVNNDTNEYYRKTIRPAMYIDINKVQLEENNLKVKAGDIITFGKYEQDTDESNGKEAIEWEVLSSDGEKALVISKYALDAQPYDKSNSAVTWETSSLREWLNNDFINDAFSNGEQDIIKTVTLVNSDNPYTNGAGGNDTSDKVFCLSLDEIESLYNYSWQNEEKISGIIRELICMPTALAVKNGVYAGAVSYKEYKDSEGQYNKADIGKSGAMWWVRTTYKSEQLFSCCVGNYGTVGADYYMYNGADQVAVRPAMYIDISSNSEYIALAPEKYDYKDYVWKDVIEFGKYEQDGDDSNGKENIEWEILSIEPDKMLLISKYALDAQPYDNSNSEVTWETSSLREWLNNDFVNAAFSSEEQKRLVSSSHINEDNKYYGTQGGNETSDKVFCFDLSEISKYLGFDYENAYPYYGGFSEDLMCTPTAYAIQQGAFAKTISESDYNELKMYSYSEKVLGKVATMWWTRLPGETSSDACYVGYYGRIDSYGYIARANGTDVAVRPVIYIEY